MTHVYAEAARSSRNAAGSEFYSCFMRIQQIVGSIPLFCLIGSIGICYIFVVTCTEYLLSSFTSKTDLEKNH